MHGSIQAFKTYGTCTGMPQSRGRLSCYRGQEAKVAKAGLGLGGALGTVGGEGNEVSPLSSFPSRRGLGPDSTISTRLGCGGLGLGRNLAMHRDLTGARRIRWRMARASFLLASDKFQGTFGRSRYRYLDYTLGGTLTQGYLVLALQQRFRSAHKYYTCTIHQPPSLLERNEKFYHVLEEYRNHQRAWRFRGFLGSSIVDILGAYLYFFCDAQH